MSKLTRILTALVLAATASATGLSAAPAQANGCITAGTGTAQDPFIVATHVNLDCIRINPSYYWNHGYHFRQTADIDMSTYLWTTAIGDDTIPFRGTYDGNGHTISGLTITSTGNNVGMFGVAYDDTLIGITLTGLSVTGNQRVGGLVGKQEGGLIKDVSVTGTVTGDSALGGLIGQVDDSADTTIRESFTAGSVAVTGFGEHTGGLVGNAHPYSRTLSIIDSYSATSVTGYTKVGGLVGTYVDEAVSERLVITDSYARGAVSGSFDTGGVIGCLYDFVMTYQCDPSLTGTVTVTDSYWDTQTTGQATTAGSRGTGKTTAQMTTLGTFGTWSITGATPGQTTWGICTAIGSGYPFLQWYAEQEGLTCSQPSPPSPTPAPSPIPASPPRDVVAVPSDASASVSWSAPASSGSYPISTYQVVATPGGATCLTSDLACEITGLVNGRAYTFRVAALSGAGWSAWSEPSAAVTPSAREQVAIIITGSRSAREISIEGRATGMGMGGMVTPWARKSGGRFQAGRDALVSVDETFEWSRKVKGKATWSVYVAAGEVRSNTVVLRSR